MVLAIGREALLILLLELKLTVVFSDLVQVGLVALEEGVLGHLFAASSALLKEQVAAVVVD